MAGMNVKKLLRFKFSIYVLLFVVGTVYIFKTHHPPIPEFVHYYMGAKYHREVRYTGLYDAYSEALSEIFGRDFFLKNIYAVRNLHDIGYIKPLQALENFKSQSWSPERWEQFLNDTRFLTKKLAENPKKPPIGHWATILIDHGYNPSPVYTSYVLPIVNAVPLNDRTLILLSYVDVLFLFLILLIIYFVAGIDALVLSFLFLITAHDMLSYCTWSLFRFDWMLALALAFLLMRREKYFFAGILWAFSASIRIFPAYMAFFTAVVWLITYKNDNKKLRELKRFVVGLVVGGVGIVGVSALLLAVGGLSPLDTYRQFIIRISNHSAERMLFNAIGLNKLFELAGVDVGPALSLLLGVVIAGFLAGYLVRRKSSPFFIGVLSILFVPAFFYLSHYYFLMLIFLPMVKNRKVNLLFSTFIVVNLATMYYIKHAVRYYSVVNFECGLYSLILVLAPVALFIWDYVESKKFTLG